MPASVSQGFALWMDGETFNALLGRQAHVAGTFLNQLGAAQVIGGVLPSGGGLNVTAPGGMTVSCNSGYCIIPSSSGSSFGGYQCSAMASTTGLTIATSDPVNPRIDLVCATVSDVGTSASLWELQVITGTPAASPSAPATPANSIALAQVTVPASASSISSGNIADVRTFVACQGGIVPVRNLSSALSAIQGYEGLYVHDRSTKRLARIDATNALKQAILFPWTPVIAFSALDVHSISTETTIVSATITTDGATDIEIFARYVGISIATGAAQQVFANFNLNIDAARVAQVATPSMDANAIALNTAFGGGTIHHVTSGAGGDTPSAATHTVSLSFVAHYDGTHQVTVPGASQYATMLYVRPVPA